MVNSFARPCVNAQFRFEVIPRPSLYCHTLTQTLVYQGIIRVAVVDNQYEDSTIFLTGEGYEDTVTLDGLHSLVDPYEALIAESSKPANNVATPQGDDDEGLDGAVDDIVGMFMSFIGCCGCRLH